MSMIRTLTDRFGDEAMDRPPSRRELYQALDQITEVLRAHKNRFEEIEGTKAAKPRVRVAAGSARP